MIAIVLMGLSMTVAAKQWKTVVQRVKEADLLARGLEIQGAIALYSATMKQGRVVPGELYPLTLEEMTKSPRPVLRKVYADPITGGDWEYVREPDGRIKGVRSSSTLSPIRQHGFPTQLQHFEGLPYYHDWVFQHPNSSTAPAAQSQSQTGEGAGTSNVSSAPSEPTPVQSPPEQEPP
jgi:type II secretory pathway pseudopilin PulG